MLDDTVRALHLQRECGADKYSQNDRFSSFADSLAASSRRAGQAFGLGGQGAIRPWRIAMLVVVVFSALWLSFKIGYWLWGGPAVGEV